MSSTNNNSNGRMATNINNSKSLLRNYNNSSNDRNGGGVVSNDNTNTEFESWACESFNLIDYLGEDASSLDAHSPDKELNEDDIQKQKEDALYSQFQYADMLIGDNHTPHQQHDFGLGDFASVPTGFHPQQSGPGSDYEDHHPSPMYYRRDTNMLNSSSNSAGQFVQHQNLDALPPYVPSTSKSSMPVIKQEPISEHEQLDVKMVLSAPTSSRESSVASSGIQTIVPTSTGTITTLSATMKPRKYRIKPETEKQTPVYRIKRAKNNDAVRRSRDKAKRVQEAKENELKFLQDDNYRKAEIISTLKSSNAQLQEENMLLKKNCRCGALGRVHKR